jgi:AbrB family looped-hinge helix DNA binding protein
MTTVVALVDLVPRRFFGAKPSYYVEADLVGNPMHSAILNSRGRITIPAHVRDSLGLKSGDKVHFFELPDGQFALVAAIHSVQSLKGMIRKPRVPVSVADMNAAIAARAADAS